MYMYILSHTFFFVIFFSFFLFLEKESATVHKRTLALGAGLLLCAWRRHGSAGIRCQYTL